MNQGPSCLYFHQRDILWATGGIIVFRLSCCINAPPDTCSFNALIYFSSCILCHCQNPSCFISSQLWIHSTHESIAQHQKAS